MNTQTEALRLTEWFDECDGFAQGTQAPHKWVLQANAELYRLHVENEQLRQALAQPEQEPYDQTALELCEKCGWKAIIPDEGCLVCARNKQEPVGYVTDSGASAYFLKGVDLDDDTPLYAAPPHYWGNVTSAELVEELRRRDMLAVPVKEQEPVAEIQIEDMGRPFSAMRVTTHFYKEVPAVGTKLYTAPPKREWVGLTDDDIEDEWRLLEARYLEEVDPEGYYGEWDREFVRAVLAKAKEKNN